MEKLQEITGESEDWINKRLSLFAGDHDVFEALRKGQIKLGHALLLNRFPEQFRAQYLDVTIASTPPARILEEWLRTCKQIILTPGQQVTGPVEQAADTPPPGVVIDACRICGGTNLVWTMEFIRVHQHCIRMILDAIAANEKGV